MRFASRIRLCWPLSQASAAKLDSLLNGRDRNRSCSRAGNDWSWRYGPAAWAPGPATWTGLIEFNGHPNWKKSSDLSQVNFPKRKRRSSILFTLKIARLYSKLSPLRSLSALTTKLTFDIQTRTANQDGCSGEAEPSMMQMENHIVWPAWGGTSPGESGLRKSANG